MKRRADDADLGNQNHNDDGEPGTYSKIETHSRIMPTAAAEPPQIQPRKKRATSQTHSEVAPSAHGTNHLDLVRNTNALSVSEFQARFLSQQPPLLNFTPKASATPDVPAKRLIISFQASSELREADLEGCFSLIEETSSEAYRKSVVRWRPKAKKEEMRDPDMRYLIVHVRESLPESSGLDPSDLPIDGFLSFMITHDDDYEYAVLYVYEIHLSEKLRGWGVGAHLMHIAETIAQQIGLMKIMLTVFTSNTGADKFYRKLGFSKDGTSPESRVLRSGLKKPPDYMILSKDVVPSTIASTDVAFST